MFYTDYVLITIARVSYSRILIKNIEIMYIFKTILYA